MNVVSDPVRSPASPDNQTLLAAVLAAQQQQQLFPAALNGRPTTVVVGVSGGADSVALLQLLTQLRPALRLDLHVAHLDHALRPESAEDAAFVAELAQKWGLPFHQRRLPPGVLSDQGDGLEAAGRRARYTFFAQVAINVTPPAQVPCLALAHHADDQAETVLLHLVRGSGLRGLGGLRWVQPLALRTLVDDAALHNVTLRVVRPLVGVRKEDLIAYLQAHGLTWREDASNQSREFLRNRLRHEVLPLLATLNPRIVETLGRTAATLAAENERTEELDQRSLAALQLEPTYPGSTGAQGDCAVFTFREEARNVFLQRNRFGPFPEDRVLPAGVDRVVLDLAGLRQQDQATQRGVLRQALAQLTPFTADHTFAASERLLTELTKPMRTRGPHPLEQGIAWSVAGATATQPALLSLHHQEALPFAPAQPHLASAWQAPHGYWPLVMGEPLCLPSGWALHSTALTPDQLPADWRQPDHPWRVYLAVDQLGEPVLTTSRPGLRFAPLGLQGKHKQLGDFFTDHKIPPSLRAGWPLLLDRQTGDVVWVCGLAIAHCVRITEQTEQVVELVWRAE